LKHAQEEAASQFLKTGDIDPLIKSATDKMTADIVKMQEAVDVAVTKMNRPTLGIDSYDDADKKNREAVMFFSKNVRARKEGQDLLLGDIRVIEQGKANLEVFNAYKTAFAIHMKNPDIRQLEAQHAKALSVGSDPDGGYTVTPEMSNRIIERQFESSPLRQVAMIETISSNALQIIEDPEEYSASRVAEGSSTANSGTAQFGKREIVAHAMEARPKATPELLEDSFMDVEAYIARKIGNKFSRIEANEFILGTGVGQARGITTYTAGTTWGTIEQINSGANGGVTYTQLAAIATGLKEAYYANARWLLHRTLIGKVLALSGNDTPLWIPSIAVGQPSTLLGYPVMFAQDFATPATDSLSGAFGDFRAGYTWADRRGITINPDPFTQKPFIEFYARGRSGGDVVDTDAIKIIKLAA
jgi:HK97 family phage major capsid protein